MQVIPAPLESNLKVLIYQIQTLAPFYRTFQIDIADGEFVANKTVQTEELITNYKSLLSNDLIFDFHLMVKDYEKEVKKLNILKNFITINNVFIHYSALASKPLPPNPIFSLGIVLNPEDSVRQLTQTYDLQTIPFIQIMSVSPGFQGSKLLPETLKKVEQLRQHNYRPKIYLDGGINLSTIPLIKKQKYQPDYLCVGSYLTKNRDLQKTVKNLNRILT